MHGCLRAVLFAVALLQTGCRRAPKPFVPDIIPESPPARLPTTGKACVVHLHGKGGAGGPTTVAGSVTHLRPAGNAEGWNGRQWSYFPASELAEVRDVLTRAVNAEHCARVVIHGFSNGAAAAAKLYCRGESLGDTVLGYVIDDPVPDHGVLPCRPRAGMRLALYSTGALSDARDGWDCERADWTCDGGTTIGIDRYASALNATVIRSPHRTHEPFADAPEETSWW